MKKYSAHYKTLTGIILLIVTSLFAIWYIDTTPLRIMAILIAFIFILSLITRKISWFKPYFTSKYNVLTNKFHQKQEFDFSRDIMFDKMIEVIKHAGFKIIETDKETGDIFATSGMTFSSWGENIYVSMKEELGKTTVDFCSACFFQVYDWGKNERNYIKLLNEFEDSLTI